MEMFAKWQHFMPFTPKALKFKYKSRSSDLSSFWQPSHSSFWNSGIEDAKKFLRTYSSGYCLGFSPNSLFTGCPELFRCKTIKKKRLKKLIARN